MIDLKRKDGDLEFDGVHFGQVFDYKENVIQKIALRLKRFYGEWFLDVTKGVDYFGFFFTKNYDPIIIEAILKEEIQKEEEVDQVTSFSFEINSELRISTVTFSANLKNGENTGNVTVGVSR